MICFILKFYPTEYYPTSFRFNIRLNITTSQPDINIVGNNQLHNVTKQTHSLIFILVVFRNYDSEKLLYYFKYKNKVIFLFIETPNDIIVFIH